MSKEYSVKILIFNRSLHVFVLPLLLMGCFLFFQTHTVWSQNENSDKKEPLHIVSDKMIAQRDNAMVEFIGNAKATQTDSVLLADSIKIFFLENADKTADPNLKNKQQGNIKQIIATGNVDYTSGDRKAFADKAVYTTVDGTLILTGAAPKLVTGTSFVTGKKITLFRNQDRILVESDGNKRVEALFNPEDKPTEKP